MNTKKKKKNLIILSCLENSPFKMDSDREQIIANVSSSSETNLLLANKNDPARRRMILTMAILFTINLINYIDRFTIAGKFFKFY